MDLVDERNEHRRRHDDQEDVREQEVGRPERHLHDLDHKLARRLRERGRAEAAAVPLAGPPRAVRLLVLELAGEEDGDEDLLDGTLDGDDGDDSENGVRRIPKLEEPLQRTLVSARTVHADEVLTKNSKNATSPRSAMKCANAAMNAGNFAHPSSIGPKKSDTKKRVRRTAAFHTTGPTAMMPIRMSGLGFELSNDLTNMYAIM